MKIIHAVESYYPSVGGMQEVVRQISERLAAMGHEVTVVTRHHPSRDFSELKGVRVESFRIVDNPVVAKTAEEQRYVDYLLNANVDVITFFAAQQWATDLALPVLNRIRAKKVSVPTGYSGLYWPEYREYYERMKTLIHGYDMNVYLSHHYRDIDFARSNGVTRTIVIPNGAGADEFNAPMQIDVRASLGIPADHFLILHVGSYTLWKGHREAITIFRKSKIRNATLLMIGNNYQYYGKPFYRFIPLAWLWLKDKLGRKNKRVILKYFPRDFTVAAYRQADLFLFPSNIECSPIVLFECGAAKLAFMSTDVGNSSEIVEWTGGGMIMPTLKDENGFSHADIAGSVKMLDEIYENAEKRKALANAGHRAWEEKFTWEKIARDYEKLYLQLTESK